ncbi:MAG TPA: hypothetical protein HPP66_05170 [Planctomycetes bacterium]|nr:hypothetical protein [Planctomycetota bacterium]
MIEKIPTNQIRDISEELSSRQPRSGGAVPNSDTDVSVQVNYASLIDQAMQASKADADAVGAARKLLLSGRLESPKNFRAAAKNIIKFGI